MKIRFLIGYFLFSSLLLAGTTGKVMGVVYDSKSKEPLIGCNIMIKGASLGTATDTEGSFFLIDIPPGKYALRVSMIGYSDYIINNLQINSDLTTQLNIPMEISALEGNTIIVNAKHELINKNLTSTTAIITGENIESLPISEVSEIINGS